MQGTTHQKFQDTITEDLNAITVMIEISAQSFPIKYEMQAHTNYLFVDRFLNVAMQFPCNYGYIPGTKGGDGDTLDALVITPYPLNIGVYIKCRPIGTLDMRDESGEDIKIIMVPSDALTKDYQHIQSIQDLEKHFPSLPNTIRHFFEHYKDLEKSKWVEVRPNWGSSDVAKTLILKSLVSVEK